jgi:hypothetical protein
MPLLFRIMRRDDDGFPTLGQSSSTLGVRPGYDVDIDAQGNVVSNGKGMSVAPAWRTISILRIPKRLKDKVSGAMGSNNTYCFKTGVGPFQAGPITPSLMLVPTSLIHGHVAPTQTVQFAQYEYDIGATRLDWQVDEN